MSSVRMCDSCGRIFPEGLEGSAVSQGSVMVRSPTDGNVRPVSRVMDHCPKCAGGGTFLEPRIEITGKVVEHEK